MSASPISKLFLTTLRRNVENYSLHKLSLNFIFKLFKKEKNSKNSRAWKIHGENSEGQKRLDRNTDTRRWKNRAAFNYQFVLRSTCCARFAQTAAISARNIRFLSSINLEISRWTLATRAIVSFADIFTFDRRRFLKFSLVTRTKLGRLLADSSLRF